MTYFPTPDPEKLRQLMNSQGYYYNLQTPPSSTGPSRQDDVWTPNTTESTLLQTTLMPTWPEQYQYGLGLLQMPTNDAVTNGMLRNDVSLLPPVSAPYDWSDDLPTPQPDYYAFDGLPRQSTTYAQPDRAVLVPTTTLWNPPPESVGSILPVQDASPSLSNYSLSSQQSDMSSPYAHSEGYIRSVGSPIIKVEHPWESTTPLTAATPAAVSVYSPIKAAPEKAAPRPLAPQRIHSSLLPRQNVLEELESEEEDVKPVLRRPTYRKAFSSENVRSGTHHHRVKREYTTVENASCSCDMCGKLFQRNYNLKAHLETHDPGRPQPHHCHYPHCGKRFVRRTDLLRHEQSVHLKTRNHQCPLCQSCFARKDTLRRHIDDGCPKRPEVKRRMSRARRASSTSSPRRPSSFTTQDIKPVLLPLRPDARRYS